MAQFPRNTPSAFGKRYRSMELHEIGGSSISGTYNGTAYVGTGRGLLIDRYWFTTFTDAGGPSGRTSATWGGTLPSDYKAGTDIRVRLITTVNTTTGTMSWTVGLAINNGTSLSNEAGTVYNTITDAVIGGGFLWHYSALSTFSGTNLTPEQDFTIIAARDSGVDGVVSDTYIKSIIIYYEVNNDGNDYTSTNFKSMMPTLRKHYKEVNFQAGDIYDTSVAPALTDGIFNGVTCVKATTGLINSIWESLDFPDATNSVIVMTSHIPIDYKQGENITVEMDWVPSASGGGNVAWVGGININALDGTAYSPEASTQYLSTQAVSAGSTTNAVITTSFTFNCSTMLANSEACFIIYRHENGGSDTFAGTARVIAMRIKIPRNTNGVTSVS